MERMYVLKSTLSLVLIFSMTGLFAENRSCQPDLKNKSSDMTDNSSDQKTQKAISNAPTCSKVAILSEEQKAKYSIMRSCGGCFDVPDPEDQNASLEQTFLIELFARPSTSHEEKSKVSTPSKAKPQDSMKIFDDHIEAVMSIFQVHSKYFMETIPESKMIGYGGKFIDKIQRIEMSYSSKKASFNEELYAMMLFSFLEDLNNHRERFGSHLATFPVTSKEYELRIMLPDYQTLSSSENPKLAFIFNIGDTIFLSHRESASKRLRIYTKMDFGDVIDTVNQKIKLLAEQNVG